MKTTLPEVEEVVRIIKTSRSDKEEKANVETDEIPEYDQPVNRVKSRKNLLIFSFFYFILLGLLWYFLKGR